MIRNLKALGLAFVAVFAMSAVAASAASAQGVLTSTGPVTLDAEEEGVNAFTGLAGVIKCPGSTATGHKTLTKAETAEGKKHQLLQSGESTVTVTPHYTNCLTTTGGEEHKTTVTMNGCDYDMTVKGTIDIDVYTVTAELVCPTGKAVQIHVYPFKGSELGGIACTITIPEQGQVESLTGLHVRSVTNVNPHDLTLTGTIHSITSNQSGFGCETAHSTTDTLHVNYTIKGTNEAQQPTAITVTDTE